MKNKKMIGAVVVSLIVVIVGFIFATKFYAQKNSEEVENLTAKSSTILVPEHAMRKGDPKAKVFVVEFFDPECESCREFHPYMHSIMTEYEGKIQWVMRYAPFHGNSVFAIKILEAARIQGKYWEALEILFQHQPEWGNHHQPRPELVWDYLPRLGIDTQHIRDNMESPVIQSVISQDINDGKELNVRGTPTFFVNGKMVEQFGPDHLRAAIDEALKVTE